jgi:hypothetical protein
MYLKFDPHAEEDGGGVEDEPGHAEAEEDEAGTLVAEEDAQQDHEGGEDPDDEDPLVKDVVQREPHVCQRRKFKKIRQSHQIKYFFE